MDAARALERQGQSESRVPLKVRGEQLVLLIQTVGATGYRRYSYFQFRPKPFA
jgi:hypothetical protein